MDLENACKRAHLALGTREGDTVGPKVSDKALRIGRGAVTDRLRFFRGCPEVAPSSLSSSPSSLSCSRALPLLFALLPVPSASPALRLLCAVEGEWAAEAAGEVDERAEPGAIAEAAWSDKSSEAGTARCACAGSISSDAGAAVRQRERRRC